MGTRLCYNDPGFVQQGHGKVLKIPVKYVTQDLVLWDSFTRCEVSSVFVWSGSIIILKVYCSCDLQPYFSITRDINWTGNFCSDNCLNIIFLCTPLRLRPSVHLWASAVSVCTPAEQQQKIHRSVRAGQSSGSGYRTAAGKTKWCCFSSQILSLLHNSHLDSLFLFLLGSQI